MRMLQISESALDSIKRMGEADRARIAVLEASLQGVAFTLSNNGGFPNTLQLIQAVLRVNTNSQVIAKDEN